MKTETAAFTTGRGPVGDSSMTVPVSVQIFGGVGNGGNDPFDWVTLAVAPAAAGAVAVVRPIDPGSVGDPHPVAAIVAMLARAISVLWIVAMVPTG